MTKKKSYIDEYLNQTLKITKMLDQKAIAKMVSILSKLRKAQGRLFILGVGGGAGHAGHAVNDFRKIAGIEAYAPTDNVSELTARINDDGWDSSYANWLMGSRINSNDVVMIFSVGGGNIEKKISNNLVQALKCAKIVGAQVIGIVGRDGGYTAEVADAVVIIPTVNPETVTPHTESFQALIWHLIVSHPTLKANAMKWESVKP
jgi:D-sedoheptulose 7-phosphate isomerase